MNEKPTTKNNIVSIVLLVVIVGGFVTFVFMQRNTPLRTTEHQFRKVCDQYYKNEISNTEFLRELATLEERAKAVRSMSEKSGDWGETSGSGLHHDIYMLRLSVQLNGYSAFLEKYESIKRQYK